jgi:5-oxoprolinase (ATP-hydrolysing)
MRVHALLERKGVAPVLVLDQGLGDLPLIGTQQRPDLFALRVERLPVLHHHVVEVAERFDLDSVVAEISQAATQPDGARLVAIALRNSYRDPSRETAIGDALSDGGMRHVSCSSDLAPLIRLLPRVQTAVIDAYLAPLMDAYLRDVADAMPQGALMVMHSAGGLESRNRYRAKDSLLSGPAAGVKGVQAIGALSGWQRLIGFDMGGTSTDVCRIDGRPDLAFEHRIGDATLFAPMLAIQTVAAGGGSICGIRHGELFVGPESAGAHPGPACYGAGGPMTLTDVNLLLGRLSEEGFGIPIDRRCSQRALDKIATEWHQDPETLLDAWIQMADERMAEAIRRISVRKGYDPADYALVSFGGAGGQHACAVARLLGIRTVLFPADAGLLSAWGLQHAHREQVVEQQILLPLDRGLVQLDALLGELAGDSGWQIDQVLLGIRFTGMDSVEWIVHRPGDDPTSRFVDQFERVYGFVPDRGLELESARVQLRRSGGRIDAPDPPLPSIGPARIRPQQVRIHGRWQSLDVMPRSAIRPGQVVNCALLVLDPYSTTLIEPGWEVTCDDHGTLSQYENRAGVHARSYNNMSLSRRPKHSESEGIGIAEIPVVESTQESKTGDSIPPGSRAERRATGGGCRERPSAGRSPARGPKRCCPRPCSNCADSTGSSCWRSRCGSGARGRTGCRSDARTRWCIHRPRRAESCSAARG